MKRERAKVLDVADPEQRGRLRLSCAAIATSGADLGEWIEPVMPVSSTSVGLFLLPAVGDYVDLEYRDADSDDEVPGMSFLANPLFRWVATGWDKKGHVPTEFRGDKYGQLFGLVTRTGSVVFDAEASAMILVASKIRLGSLGAENPVTLADILAPILKSLFTAVQTTFNAHVHGHPIGAPTFQPGTPMNLDFTDLDGSSWHSNETYARRV